MTANVVPPAELERMLEARVEAAGATHRRARTRSTGRLRRLASSLTVAAAFLGIVGVTLAVHDEGFQLEGNVEAADTTYLDIDDTNPGNPVNTVTRAGDLCDASQEPAPGPYDSCGVNDWDTILDETGPDGTVEERAALPAGYADAGAVVDFRYEVDGTDITFDTSDGTTFTGGGSKDINPVSDWRCVGANNVTNKGDLTNVYATILDSGGDQFFYFGAEKNEDSGTNNIGLWLLQDSDVGCPPDQGGNGTAFSGAHVEGDLFIVSEFSNGGGVSTIVAYQWVDDNDPDPGDQPGLDPAPVAVGADCLDTPLAGEADRLCAVTNGETISIPWLSVFSNDIDEDQLPASFFEGGIELSAFPQFAETCFTSFLFNTRSSTSLTAELFDWALGDIDTCGTKSGTKFHDLDADGVWDAGEDGLEDWNITLYEDDGDGALEAGELASAVTQVTDADGFYEFTDLFPGDYIVCEELQTDWIQSLPHGTTTSSTDTCDLDSDNAEFGYAFEITPAEHETGNDFGNYQQGSKSGTKFEDLNADGVRDAGEDGLPNWQINVYADDGDGDLSATEMQPAQWAPVA